jgi:hypothetical protein
VSVALDTWLKIAIVCASALVALAMLLAFLRHGGRIKTPLLEAGESEAPPEEDAEPAAEPCAPACAPYVQEHTTILGELASSHKTMEATIGLLTRIVEGQSLTMKGIEGRQEAENLALLVLLDKLEGKEINGNLEKARLALTKATGVKEGIAAAVAGARAAS